MCSGDGPVGFLGAGGALPHEVTSLHDLASGQGTRKVEWGAGLRPGAVEVSVTTRLRLPGCGEPCGGGRVRDPCGGKGGWRQRFSRGTEGLQQVLLGGGPGSSER